MIKRILLTVFTLALFLPIIIIYQIYVPVDKSSKENKIVEIRRGIVLKEVTKILKDRGLIHNEITFEIITKLKKIST